MKAITLHQPWASLIAHGVKTIETRSWAPPRVLIGERIAIHAGMKREQSGRLHPATHAAILDLYGIGWGDRIPMGAVVATALLENSFQFKALDGQYVSLAGSPEPRQWAVDPHGDFSPGRWLWMLTDIECLPAPIPARGHQRLWDWEPNGGKAL